MTAEKVNFDNYAEDYEKILGKDLKFFGEENSYFAEYKVKIIKNIIKKDNLKILEYGCGIGRNLKYLKHHFRESEISACDISHKSIEIARKYYSEINYFLIDETNLKNKINSYDLIFISGVLHHIKPETRNDFMKNIYYLLKKDAYVFIFEHNPYNPITKNIVNECIWDSDAILIKPSELKNLIRNSGLELIKIKYTLFFPKFLKFLRKLENFIGFIPAGGQYFVYARKSIF